jgi:hypothetical protein
MGDAWKVGITKKSVENRKARRKMSKRKPIIAIAISLGLLLLVTSAAFADEGNPRKEDNPVIQFLASLSGQSPEDVLSLREGGFSLGNIGRAYLFAGISGGDPAEILARAKGRGWGVLAREAGLHPRGGGRGLGWMIGKAHGRPDHAGEGKPAWAGGPHSEGE